MTKEIKICFFSDTHGDHIGLNLPDCDIAVCSGDISMMGRRTEVESFLDWFSKQKATHKVFIAGNHDYWFDKEHPKSLNHKLEDDSHLDLIPDGIVYLENSMVEIEGIKIWGSPVTPWFYNWAFNKMPEDLKSFWGQIPEDVDIVVTHGPPSNTRLDLCRDGNRAGCPSLYNRLLDVKPKICTFGHIHEGYGVEDWEIEGKNIRIINSSVLNERYRRVNDPVIVDWDEICRFHENK